MSEKKLKIVADELTPAELRESQIDGAISKLYNRLKPTINDPELLAVTVAKLYAHSYLATYIQHKEVKSATKQNS